MINAWSEMSYESLEGILKNLPQPDFAEVSLWGNFDYSNLLGQAKDVGANLKVPDRVAFRLQPASKEDILQIYKKHKEPKDNIAASARKGVALDKIIWYWGAGNRGKLEVTPFGITVQGSGKQPDYISKLIPESSGREINFSIRGYK
jgi:hypothetical protein